LWIVGRSPGWYGLDTEAEDDGMICIAELWDSGTTDDWEAALGEYWGCVQPQNRKLERTLNLLTPDIIAALDAHSWYEFLHDQYFRWKYTAPNRYVTTTKYLVRYSANNELDVLDGIRTELLALDGSDIRKGLRVATLIRGLGIAGASGLLSLLYPQWFATVDQFVVKALHQIPGLPETADVRAMNPQSLSLADGVLLTEILCRKADDNNRVFQSDAWTPRKIDMVLWAVRVEPKVARKRSCRRE